MKKTQGNPNNFFAFKASAFKTLFVISFLIFSVSATIKIIKFQKNTISKKILSILEETSKSTALIISNSDPKNSAEIGFFIAGNLLVTNSQLPSYRPVVLKDGIQVVFIETQEGVRDIGFVIVFDKKSGLRIIKTLKDNHKALNLEKYSQVKVGDEIFFLHSHTSLVQPLSKRMISVKKDILEVKSLIPLLLKRRKNKFFFIHYSKDLIGSSSKGMVSAKIKFNGSEILQITPPIIDKHGGLVFSKDKKVIGFTETILIDKKVFNATLPIIYLNKLIRENNKNLPKNSEFNIDKILKESKKVIFIENKKFKDLKTDIERGTYHNKKENYKKAFYWFKKSAEQGNASAQVRLGDMYQQGQGVPQKRRWDPKNYKKAFYWFKKAAEQGDPTAQFRIGEMYKYGRGVSQNNKHALYWFKKLAEQGYYKAQYEVGWMMYLGSEGVPQNYKKAFYWFKKLADKGNHFYQNIIGKMYYNGQGVPKNYKKAFYWYKKSAEQGLAGSQRYIGFMYIQGQGIPQNYKQALYWSKKAAEQRDAEAQHNIGTIYAQGLGVPKNYKKAFYWYKRSAEQGVVEAQYNIGVMYAQRLGVPKNYKKAFYWFKKLAEQGHAKAQYNIGTMYAQGQGVPKNFIQSYLWVNLAASNGDKPATNFKSLVLKTIMSSNQIATVRKLSIQKAEEIAQRRPSSQ